MVLSGLTLEKMFGLLNFKGAAPDIKLIFKLYLNSCNSSQFKCACEELRV